MASWFQPKHFGIAVCLLLILSAFGAYADERGMRHEKLGAVYTWFYILDFNIESSVVRKISASAYDMVVVEPIFTERENTDFQVAEMVRRLKGKQGKRLVIAYIDIGEAEEWRTYWKRGWRIGSPKWIVANDPDGWEGNFPVAYWHPEWRKIWLGENGYIQAIVDAGFDGIYLDWIEAYSDENVIAAAKRDKVEPRQEMIRWVRDLANRARRDSDDFLVIAQNAAELAENPDYVSIIDAIAQEQVWFDGGADNDPAGDCPLPATQADIESRLYLNSLTQKCRNQHNRYPESTLHTSSDEYISQLKSAREKGLQIFTVDYALKEKNIRKVYDNSRNLGFIPYAAERALTTFRSAR